MRAYALVDDEDFEWLNQWRWALTGDGCYVSRKYRVGPRSGNRTKTIRMHRAILGLDEGHPFHVDHLNHDGLDNRRGNLRVVTRFENMQNRLPQRGSSSRFRGVSWDRRRQRWAAETKLYGRRFWLGYFEDEAEAGRAVEALHASVSA